MTSRADPAAPHDWERIARQDAFWGVLTDEAFRARALDDARIASFYATGDDDTTRTIAAFRDLFGAAPEAGPNGARALDIGCGVGRLARAMRGHASFVTGYDVSPTMLEHARRHAGGDGLAYVNDLPAGPFDWINSYIVLQHIQPAEGLALLRRALALAAPGAFVSIQVTAWSEHVPRRPLHRLRRAARMMMARLGFAPVEMLLLMHAYNMTDVLRVFAEAGFADPHLRHTNHGGHHGFWIFARRADKAGKG